MRPARDGIGSLSETDAAQLTSLLENFVGETQADCAVLCDRSGRLLGDPLLDTYLRSMGSRLASRSEAPEFGFEFFAVDDDSINAFALPGGYIGIHTGLLLATDNEAELAGVDFVLVKPIDAEALRKIFPPSTP